MEASISDIWNHFLALERAKPPSSAEASEWLDLFLSRALFAKCDDTNNDPSGIRESLDLSRIWMKELRNLCLHFEESKDHLPLKDFLLRGRGWKILALLDRNARIQPAALWWSMEFVDLLINLFQLSLESDESSPPSSMPIEKEQELLAQFFPEQSPNFSDVIDLWMDVKSRYVLAKKRHHRRRRPRQAGRGNSASPPLQGFPERTLGGGPPRRHISNLHRFEESDSSSDSSDNRHRPRSASVEIQAFPSNPLDFEYFERMMHSEDEAKFLIDWNKRREKREVAQVGVCGTVQLELKCDDLMIDPSLRISEGQSCLLVVSLLVTLCGAEVRKRNLKASYELSLKLISFAADSLLQLSKGTSVAVLNPVEKVSIQLQLMKLLQVALAEMQFNPDYMMVLQNNNVMNLCLATLSQLSELCDTSHSRATLQLAASTLHIVESFQTFSDAILSKQQQQQDEKKSISVFEWFCVENGAGVMEKLLSWASLTLRNNVDLHEDIILMIRALTACLSSVEKSANASPKASSTASSLYTTTVRLVVELVRKDKVGLTALQEVYNGEKEDSEKIARNAYAHLVSQLLGALCTSPVQGLVANVIWDQILSALVQSTVCQLEQIVISNMFALVEGIVTQECHAIKIANLIPVGHGGGKRDTLVSDSDSAFYASDGSIEKTINGDNMLRGSSRPRGCSPKQVGSLLRNYLELLESEHPLVVRSTTDHLVRLTQKCPWHLRYYLFTQVVVSQLDKKYISCSSDGVSCPSGLEVEVLQQFLALIPPLLASKDILNFFHHHKIFKSVIALTSVQGLIEVAYDAIGAYLSCEIRFVLQSSSPLPAAAVTSVVGITVESESELHVTEEDAFQPDFMKALSLTATVRRFHEMLLSRTAKVLDNKENDIDAISLMELQCAWRTQRDLVNQFDDYQDYAQSKGISRVMEELFVRLTKVLQRSDVVNYYKLVIAVLGYLVEILEQFSLAKSKHDDSMSSFPCSYFDEAKILDQNLKLLCITSLSLERPAMLRLLIRSLLDATRNREYPPPSEEPFQSTLSAPTAVADNVVEEDEEQGYDGGESETEESIRNSTAAVTCCEIRSTTLVNFVRELAVALLEKTNENDEVAEYAIYSVRHLCEQSQVNVRKLLDSDFLAKLLKSSALMATTNGSLRREVMSLVAALATQRMSRTELRLKLDLFKIDSYAGRRHLLQCVRTVSRSSADALEPQYSIRFPPQNDDSLSSGQDMRFTWPLAVGASLFFGSQMDFSASFWLSLPCGPQQKTFKIFSLGDKTVQLEVLTDFSALIVRITQGEQRRVAGSATFNCIKAFKNLRWNNVVVTCSGKAPKAWEINAVFNGVPVQQRLLIPQKVTFASPEAPETYLAIGHLENSSDRACQPYYHLASLMLFTGLKIGEDAALVLFLMGPEGFDAPVSVEEAHVRACKKDILRLFPEHGAKICRGDLFSHLVPLRQGLFLSFNPERRQVIVNKKPTPDGGSFLGNLVQQGKTSTAVANFPRVVEAAADGSGVAVTVIWKFGPLLMEEGGIVTLVLLVARMAEQNATDEELAIALDVLFLTMNSSPPAKQDFIANDGVQLLNRILSDDMCDFGIHSVKTILDHSSSTPLLAYDENEKTYFFDKNSNSIIHNPSAIVLLLLCWSKLGQQELNSAMRRSLGCHTCLEVVLKGFSLLLRGEHLHSKLNVETFKQLMVAKTLVYKLVEDVSYSSQDKEIESATSSVADSIVLVFAALVGSPPDLKVINDIMTSLLLVHESKLTFVSHSKSSFYFHLACGGSTSSVSSRTSSESAGVWQQAEKIRKKKKQECILDSTDSCHTVLNGSKATDWEKQKKKSNHYAEGEASANKENDIHPKNALNSSCSIKANRASKREDDKSSRSSSATEVNSDVYQDALDSIETQDQNGVNRLPRYDGVLEHPGPWGLDDWTDSGDISNQSASDRLISGLLTTLFGALQNVSDADLTAVVNDIVHPEYIIILCNHPVGEIREKGARLLWQYIHRSSSLETHGYRLQKINGYFLLANQLHGYPATEGIVDACLSIVHDREFHLLDESPEIPSHSQVIIRSSGMITLLAILPNTVFDVALAHALIVHVHELFAKVPGMLRNLRSLGLFECLCKTLLNLSQVKLPLTDILGQDSRDIVIQDLHDFLRLISIRFVPVHGSENFGAILDLIHLLLWIALRDAGKTATVFSAAACVVLEECFSELQTRLFQIDNPLIHNNSKNSIYGALFPLEEMADMLMAPRGVGGGGSVASQDSSALLLNYRSSSPDNAKVASRSELAERFAALVDLSIDFLMASLIQQREHAEINDIPHLDNLTSALLSIMIAELRHKWESPKAKTVFANQQKLRKRLLTLVNHSLSPDFVLERRLRLLKIINKQFRNVEILGYLFENVQVHANTFMTYLEDLIVLHREEMDEDDIAGCKYFYEFMQTIVRRVPPAESSDFSRANSIRFEVEKLKLQAVSASRSFQERCEAAVSKLGGKFQDLGKTTAQFAVQVTKTAMKAQDEERKRFMAMIRSDQADRVRTQQLWQVLIERHTHERAAWHFPGKYIHSWSLSEVEGAQRTRVRLERKRPGIAPKYYLPAHQHKAADSDRPFQYLGRGPTGMSGVIVEQLNSNDSIRFMEKASLIIPDVQINGEVLISNNSLYFVANTEGVEGADSPVVSFTWRISTIREIHRRWYQLNDTAVEVFFSSSTTKFFVLGDRKLRNDFIKRLVETQPKLSDIPDPDLVMKQWQDGSITNFDYLMQLNKLAGRSFNDLMQYPIFPFVLADYSSATLNLYNEGSYRNLRKPIAVQDAQKEKRFVNTYKTLADELAKNPESSHCPSLGPFHYGSHYSNSGIVLHFLIRVPPFTAMFLKYQDGNFDLPDRSFHSLINTWKLASQDSTTDVKELIPDMFCLPELLVNSEGLNFGAKQDGKVVNDVILPLWATSPRLFIKIHRQALESNYVREHLNHWIDLVFGYKQSGKEAISNINVFHPATYYGFDLSTIEDPMQREARATMIKTYGQTPKQLFKKPHPMVNKSYTELPKKSDPPAQPRVLDSVVGLRWGNFLGSPSQAELAVVWRASQATIVGAFVSLANNEVYSVPESSCLVAKYAQEQSLVTKRTFSVAGALLLTYSHPDGIVRAKIRKSASPTPFFTRTDGDDVSCIGTHPETSCVWIGFKSGRIIAQGFRFNAKELQLSSAVGETTSLFGHSDRVSCLDVCPEFGVALSGSEDNTAILWDVSSLAYILSLRLEGGVTHVKVAKTSGDLIVVNKVSRVDGEASRLSVYSINGTVAGTEMCKPAITSLTASSMPEGVSCNIIITGQSDGMLRLWNSWNLQPLRNLPASQGTPVVALTFSFDNQNLYAGTGEGEVIIFEKSDVTGVKNEPKFVNLMSV